MIENLVLCALTVTDAPALSKWLRGQSPEYSHFFRPFAFDEESISEVLGKCQQDLYMGIYWQEESELGLIGFYMLRGWDAGYEVPAYGVLIDERYRGLGLEMVSLEASKIVCRLRGAPRLMLKMHPDNCSTRGIARKSGFVKTGVEAHTGNYIYHLEIAK